MGAKWRNVKKQSSNDTYWLETCRTMMREHVLPHVDFAGLFKLNTSSERYPLRILELCCAPGGFAEAIMEHVKGSQGRSPLYFGLTLPERDGGLRLSLKPHFYYPGFWSNEDWLKGPRERGLLAELAAERVIGGFVPIIMDVNDVNAKDLEGSCPPLHQRSFHIVITDGAWSGLGVAEAVAMKLNQIAAALKVLKPGGTLICRGRCSGFWADIVALFFLIFREVKLVKPSSGLSSSLQTNSFCIYVLSGFREEVAEFPIDDKGTTARFKREQLVDWVLSLRDILLAVGPVGLTQTPESTGTPMVAVTSEETILEMNSISSDVVELKPASLRSSGVGFRAEKEVTLSVELLGSFRRRQSSRDVGAEMSRVVTLSVELLGSLRNFLKPAETPRIAEYPTDEHKTTTSTLQSEASTVTSPLNRPNRTAWLRMRRALEWTLVSPVTAAAVHELFRKTALIRSTNFVEVALQLAFHSVMLPESLYKLLHRPDVLSRIYGVSEEAPSGVIPLIHRQKFVREWDFYDIVSWGAEMTAPMLELGAKHLGDPWVVP
ncbi:MAG: uncharacterized protein KVP18_002281 [Porospora cf. gigantea A]|uniref:uncharacterized protein n=1 Tax=Porospora cf. gigantea A TaxID=2853593 RepID=UPI0035598EA7|nr:MAG: hypothetical protein KVP18_002281 [Porospora cf. gigantea A]